MKRVFVEGTLRISGGDSGDVRIVLFSPMHLAQDWCCEYSIELEGQARHKIVFGFDSFQALVLSLRALATDVFDLEQKFGAKMIWSEDGAVHGFPESFRFK